MNSDPFTICITKPEVALGDLPVIPAVGPICLDSEQERGCMAEIEIGYIDSKGICDSMGGSTTIDYYWSKREFTISYDRLHVDTVQQIREFLWKCQFNNKTVLQLDISGGCCDYYNITEPIDVYLELESEKLTSRSGNGCFVEDFTLKFTEYGTCSEGLLNGPVGVIGV